MVRTIPVGPRSGEVRSVVGGRVPSGLSSMFAGRGRGGMNSGFGLG